MSGFAADRKRLIVITSVFVVLTVSFAFAIYLILSDDSSNVKPIPQILNRTSEERRRLLYGNDSTIVCGIQLHSNYSTATRVSHGRNALLGEFPWHVVLGNSLPPGIVSSCGGAIIGNQWILTDAHCFFTDTSPASKYAVLGVTDLTSGPGLTLIAHHVKVNITKIFRHPQYNSETSENDIALYKTADKMNLTGEGLPIVPVCLPDLIDEDYSGIASFSGFGAVIINQPEQWPTLLLQTADMQIVSYESCMNYWNDYLGTKALTHKHLCASNVTNGVNVCYGDSGGPLVQLGDGNFTVIGIASLADLNCQNLKRPAIFTKVSSYLKWIFDTIEMNQ